MADNDQNSLPANPPAFDLVPVDHQPAFDADTAAWLEATNPQTGRPQVDVSGSAPTHDLVPVDHTPQFIAEAASAAPPQDGSAPPPKPVVPLIDLPDNPTGLTLSQAIGFLPVQAYRAVRDAFTLPGDVSASARYWADDLIEPEVTVSSAGEMLRVLTGSR